MWSALIEDLKGAGEKLKSDWNMGMERLSLGDEEFLKKYSDPLGGKTVGQDFIERGKDSKKKHDAWLASLDDDRPSAPAAPQVDLSGRDDVLKGFQADADAYNASVNTFNQNFDQYQNLFDQNKDAVGSATIRNIWDDPLTEANENLFTSSNQLFSDAASDLSSFSLPDAPVFDGSEYDKYGFTADELPTLAEAKDYAGLAEDLGGLSTTLSDLNRQRAAEEGRISDFATSLGRELGSSTYGLDRYQRDDGTYDLSGLANVNNIDRLLYGLNEDRSYFDSDILDQMGGTFEDFDQRYQDASNLISGVNTAADAERKRIAQTQQGIYDYVDELGGLGDYDITSGAALDDLKSAIDTRQKELGRFDSDLDFNFSPALSELQGQEDILDALIGARDMEQSRIDQYRKGLEDYIFDYGQDASGYGIKDLDKINALKNRIDNLKTQAGRFDSELGFDFSDVLGEGSDLSGIEAGLANLLADRAAEEERIGAEGTRLSGLADAYKKILEGDPDADMAGLTIADLGQIEELQRNIDQAQMDASRFDSELSTFDAFNYPMQDLGFVEDDLASLLGEREDELGRIEAAQENYARYADAAEKAATSGNYYSKAALDAIQEKITQGQRDIDDFSSLLPYDFGAAGQDGTAFQDYADAQALLDELSAKRSGKLDEVQTSIADAIKNIDSTELHEEDAFNKMLADLSGAGYDLDYFSGGRVGDIAKALSENKKTVSDRLDDLYAKREGLEGDASDLLENLLESRFDRSAYDEYSGLLEGLSGDVDLYNASQASDEITALERELASRLGLIEADELALQERLNRESSDYAFNDFSLIEPDESRGFYTFDDEEEEEEGLGSAFSQNVRV